MDVGCIYEPYADVLHWCKRALVPMVVLTPLLVVEIVCAYVSRK